MHITRNHDEHSGHSGSSTNLLPGFHQASVQEVCSAHTVAPPIREDCNFGFHHLVLVHSSTIHTTSDVFCSMLILDIKTLLINQVLDENNRFKQHTFEYTLIIFSACWDDL